MELKLVKSVDNEGLRNAWKRMEQERGISPFLYYDYMRYVWNQVKFCSFYVPVVACVMEDEEYLMILPLKWDVFKHRYKMLSDTMGVGLADALFNERLNPSERMACAAFFFSHIDRKVKLARLPEDSVLLKVCQTPVEERKVVRLTRIPFPDGVDALIHSLTRNGKESVRRANNRMKRDGIEPELRLFFGNENPMDKKMWQTLMTIYLDRLFAKHKHGGKKGKGSLIYKYTYNFKSRYMKHDTKSLRRLPNTLHAVLMHDDKVMAFCLCLMDHHGECLVNPRLAINDEYSHYSPGYALLTRLMRYLEENTNCRLLDLSRGCEQYKMNLGGSTYYTYQIDQ